MNFHSCNWTLASHPHLITTNRSLALSLSVTTHYLKKTATDSPLTLLFSVLNKPNHLMTLSLALHVLVSRWTCSCPVRWSSADLTGFSFATELKAGYCIPDVGSRALSKGENNHFPQSIAVLSLTQANMNLACFAGKKHC